MLAPTIDLLKQRRLQGVAIICNAPGIYLALAVSPRGVVCDPRNWDTHPTPEAALKALHDQLSETAEPEPDQVVLHDDSTY